MQCNSNQISRMFFYSAFGSEVDIDQDDPIERYDKMLHQSLDKTMIKRSGDFWEHMLILEREPIVSKSFTTDEFKKLSLLWITVMAGYHKSAKLLVHSGSDVNERFGCHYPQPIDKNLTILHLLLQMVPSPKNEQLIRLVMDHGADLQAKDDDGQTPLHYAVENNHVQLTKMLLEKGADVNATDKRGMTPLLLTASRVVAVDDLVPLLMKHGADLFVKDLDGLNVLNHITMNYDNSGCLELIKSLLENGVSPHGKDQNDLQPIHYAIGHGNYELVKIFLDHGVDVNVQCNGQPLLYYAACINNIKLASNKKIVETLLKHGADVHQRTYQDHCTALHGICGQSAICNRLRADKLAQHVEGIIELLLFAGADVLAENCDGKTPLVYILEHSNEDDIKSVGYLPLGTCQIIKMLALRKTHRPMIELKDEGIIKRFPVLWSYYQECIEEIERMKSERFIETCTLFDLLAKSEYQIALLMHNPEFVPKFKLCSLGIFSEFPIYSGDLFQAFKRAERYFDSMLEQEDIVNEAVFYTLPYLVVRNVVYHILEE